MASPAITAFNTFVDGLNISNAAKTNLKARGEVYYAAVVKEVARHIRKHILAVRDSDPAKADFFNAVVQRLLDEDDIITIAFAQAIEGG